MTQPPLIGITTSGKQLTGSFYLTHSYVDAVRAAGGIPILLPPGEPSEGATILRQVDGLIFSGGGDIDPAIYQGQPHPTIYNVDPERDRSEISLAQLALTQTLPILGICRGLEVLLIATGGSLVPHVPDKFGEEVFHRAEQLRPIEHSVKITDGSCLAKMMAATAATVVSWHHQAADTVPSEWRVTAKAADGVVEAIEHQHHPWAIALQWHPELSPGDPLQQGIFQTFVAATQRLAKVSDEPPSTPSTPR